MSIRPHTTRIRIHWRRAAPDNCPVCGASSKLPPRKQDEDLIHYIFRSYYSHPNRIFSLPVPGWDGYVEWWYECKHVDPIVSAIEEALTTPDPFWNRVVNSSFSREFEIPFSGISPTGDDE